MKVAVDTDRIHEVDAAVDLGLTAHTDRFLPLLRERKPFAVSLRDASNSVVGGLVGEFRLDWLQVSRLWVDESLRGKGYGAQLLAKAEGEARTAGATHISLWTQSFQAPAFYVARGYVECGRIKDHPKGHDAILFVKWLV
jgi:GNAT superfamily N-acetyltransferase